MVASALSMDASQYLGLAQRTQSRKGMSYDLLGPDDVRRYTVNVYLVKNAKPLQWMLANILEDIWSRQPCQWMLASGADVSAPYMLT